MLFVVSVSRAECERISLATSHYLSLSITVPQRPRIFTHKEVFLYSLPHTHFLSLNSSRAFGDSTQVQTAFSFEYFCSTFARLFEVLLEIFWTFPKLFSSPLSPFARSPFPYDSNICQCSFSTRSRQNSTIEITIISYAMHAKLHHDILHFGMLVIFITWMRARGEHLT